MKIETQRLILRDYRPEDLEIYYTLKAEPTVWEDLGGAAVHQKGEAAKLLGDTIASQISSDTGYRALCLKDGTFIGEAGILPPGLPPAASLLGERLCHGDRHRAGTAGLSSAEDGAGGSADFGRKPGRLRRAGKSGLHQRGRAAPLPAVGIRLSKCLFLRETADRRIAREEPHSVRRKDREYHGL